MAPFWRGLNDFKEDWTEHQLVAAARGLPIPAADEVPPEDPERPMPAESPRSSSPNLQNLTVPISSRSHSYASDASATLSPSHPAFSLPPPTSPVTSSSPHLQPSTPFRPRSKTLASLTTSSKSPSQTDMVPREIQLPQDPYVNGQAMEAFLYKDAIECPICFVYYPPYLNKTRCCDQPICSECFVQIKRPDPHPPEHTDPSNPTPQRPETQGDPEGLVSEPANCPYCQQAEFGVTYEPPPFRRGLAYAGMGHRTPLGNVTSAMSSTSSLNSLGSPSLAPTSTPRRRTTSISANASTVITTDRIRPDWATKLANARNHAARRSAAATALHTAAYLMGNGMADSRGFAFTSRGRFGRRGMDSPVSGAATPPTPQSAGAGPGGNLGPFSVLVERHEARNREAAASGQAGAASRRRSRMDDLEDMMMLEAIRLSLAAEEERKRKEEKEARKEAKKKEKADKKAEKAAKKSMYSAGGTSSASASGSALSLSLPGLGRRRGNSGSSTLLREAAMNADKGKNVDRSNNSGPAGDSSTTPLTIGKPAISTVLSSRQHLDTGLAALPLTDAPQPSPTATAPEKPSHLRQMSNASSPASSFMESLPGSLRNGGFHGSSSSLDSPNTSGTHLGGGTPDREADAGSAGTEPMFNFRSLAEMMGREEEKEDAAKHIEHLNSGDYDIEEGESSVIIENPFDDRMEISVSTLKADDGEHDYSMEITPHPNGDGAMLGVGSKLPTPELMVTPVTPAASSPREEESKQLGVGMQYLMDDGRNVTQ
jgi:hypothetical protein